MEKARLIGCCMALLLACGCAGVYSSVMEDSPIVLAYGEDQGVKDPSEVATLVINKTFSLWLNGIPIKQTGGIVTPAFRESRNLAGSYTTMVDVLPGIYKVAIMGSVSAFGNTPGSARTYTTTSPTEQTCEFHAGQVYSVELTVFGATGHALIREMPAEARQTVIDGHNKALF